MERFTNGVLRDLHRWWSRYKRPRHDSEEGIVDRKTHQALRRVRVVRASGRARADTGIDLLLFLHRQVFLHPFLRPPGMDAYMSLVFLPGSMHPFRHRMLILILVADKTRHVHSLHASASIRPNTRGRRVAFSGPHGSEPSTPYRRRSTAIRRRRRRANPCRGSRFLLALAPLYGCAASGNA